LVSRHDGNHRKGPIFRYAGSFQIRGCSQPSTCHGVPAPKLEADAISAAQDAFIGAALVGPTVSVALTLAALATATAYGAPLTLALTAVPVLVIANAYRRLNLWNANCGASFEWVGHAINPYHSMLRCRPAPGSG
jgi:hypothetical protein